MSDRYRTVRLAAVTAGVVWAGVLGGCKGGASQPPPEAERRFAEAVDVSPLRTLPVQFDGRVTIMDTLARRSIDAVHHGLHDGQDAVFTYLDWMFRIRRAVADGGDDLLDRPLIYIQAVPVREHLVASARGQGTSHGLRRAEWRTAEFAGRLIRGGWVSSNFLRAHVESLRRLESSDGKMVQPVGQVWAAWETLAGLDRAFCPAPPVAGSTGDPWLSAADLLDIARAGGEPHEARGQPWGDAGEALAALESAWLTRDADMVNARIVAVRAALDRIRPEGKQSPARRAAELLYNRARQFLFTAVFYLVATVLLVLAVVGRFRRAYVAGMVFFVLALALHTLGQGLRWYVSGTIPLANQFESMFSAGWFAAFLTLVLEAAMSRRRRRQGERRWPRGLFALGGSVVGWLLVVIVMASPILMTRPISSEIHYSDVAGVLRTYWLHIHVSLMVASYALIIAAAVISVIYLVTHRLAGRGRPTGAANVDPSGADGARGRSGDLRSIDTCNLVILQLAFWLLGAGIVTGAVWADVAWGRPWGWDPKETFALITWFVYLGIVHVRLVTPKKGLWTAWLALVGLVATMFNWFGVNFLLQGLHSYA